MPIFLTGPPPPSAPTSFPTIQCCNQIQHNNWTNCISHFEARMHHSNISWMSAQMKGLISGTTMVICRVIGSFIASSVPLTLIQVILFYKHKANFPKHSHKECPRCASHEVVPSLEGEMHCAGHPRLEMMCHRRYQPGYRHSILYSHKHCIQNCLP